MVITMVVMLVMMMAVMLVVTKNWLKKLREVGESCSCAEALSCNEPAWVLQCNEK